MAWITPIVNWIASNVLTSADMNRIEGNTQHLKDNKVDKVAGKSLSTEDYTTAEKTKLSGIETGAQVNTVTSVAGKTGAVSLVSADFVGLDLVLNYGIATKAEAEAGTSNAKYMTPLRVKEGIEFIGKPVIGSYVGNGTSSRTISLGFQPSAVLVIPVEGQIYYDSRIYGGLALIGKPAETNKGTAVTITTTGFTVRNVSDSTWGIYTNQTNGDYRYVAFR